jgi:hypothetical protein
MSEAQKTTSKSLFKGIPAGYNYRMICPLDSDINKLIGEFCECNGHMYNFNRTAVIATGEYDMLDIKVYVVDNHNSCKMYYYFNDASNAMALISKLNELKKISNTKNERPLYLMTIQGWKLNSSYDLYEENNYLGYRSYVNRVLLEISNLDKYSKFLNSIGEGNKTLNYLLYGAPGTGKTTLVKIIANKLKLPIYNIKGIDTSSFSVASLLSPKTGGLSFDTVILLFEDFDRNISEGKMTMSDILNALDGIQNNHKIIRFFTGNDCDVIFKNKALISRFNGIFKYNTPTMEMIKHKLYKFLSIYT